MSGATRGFPTAPDDVAAIAAALIGDPVLYQPVLLGQLGPDLMGGGFGLSQWDPANYVGTWTAGKFTAIGAIDLVAGYVSQQAESIKKITVFGQQATTAEVVINVWACPLGGAWAVTGDTITIANGEQFAQIACDIVCALGTRIAFEIDVASNAWALVQGAVSIYGLRSQS